MTHSLMKTMEMVENIMLFKMSTGMKTLFYEARYYK